MKNPKLKLLEGWIFLEDLAEEVDRHPRTVKRWTQMPNGLPFAMMGNITIFHIETAREWLMGRMQKPNQRRHAA